MAVIMENKKGIFFTLIAIMLMTIFIFVFTPQADISFQRQSKSTEARIGTINKYFDDLSTSYLETSLKASAQRTIISLIYYMNETGSYLPDLNNAFKEVIINGTINKIPIDSITKKKLMENYTLFNLTNKIINISLDTLNVNTTVIFNNASVSQTKPWAIDARLNVTILVQSSVAVWQQDSIVASSLSIEGFYDPYYLVSTNGLYPNRIKKSSVEFNKWNVTLFREHIMNGTYVHWADSNASSFLMRFTNDMTNSTCCGIESIVNPNMLSTPDQKESYVDYLFWTHVYNSRCEQIFNLSNPETGGGIWNEFRFSKLETDHATRYNITAFDAKKDCQ